MRTKRIGVTAVFLAAAFVFSGAWQQESAKQLFQRALHLEETKGDLEKAVEVYKRIVAEFPDDRVLAAQSFYHLGLCYEKLGLEEAQKAFNKVVEDYPDQTDAVKAAKEKLSLLLRARAVIEKGGKEFKITKIHEATGRNGWLSPDGTRLALNDYNTNALWLRDVMSGKEVCLIPPPEPMTDCFWSPDSKLIAYYTHSGDIKIVPADGGRPKTLSNGTPKCKRRAGIPGRRAGQLTAKSSSSRFPPK